MKKKKKDFITIQLTQILNMKIKFWSAKSKDILWNDSNNHKIILKQNITTLFNFETP